MSKDSTQKQHKEGKLFTLKEMESAVKNTFDAVHYHHQHPDTFPAVSEFDCYEKFIPKAATPPTPVSRTAEEIEQMAYEIYPHDVPMESPGDQCKNHHYRQAYISGFQKAMELYRTHPEERERIAGDAWNAAMDYVKEREDYHYGKRGGYTAPDKEQYLSSIK